MRSRAQEIAIILSKYRKKSGARFAARTKPPNDPLVISDKLSRRLKGTIAKNIADKEVNKAKDSWYRDVNYDNKLIKRAGKSQDRVDRYEKHRPRPEHGLREKSKAARSQQKESPIYMRPEDLEPQFEPGYQGNEKYWRIKAEGGSLKTGPLTLDELPDVLYHTSTNVSAVKSSGVLRGQSDGGGLGGGSGMSGISLSTSKADALLTQTEIRRAIQVAKLPHDASGAYTRETLERFARIDEQKNKLPRGSLQPAVEGAMYAYESNVESSIMKYIDELDHHGERIGRSKGQLHPDARKRLQSLSGEALSAYTRQREHIAGDGKTIPGVDWKTIRLNPKYAALKNPLILGSTDFSKYDEANVGIIEIPKHALPTGALVREGTDDYLSEIRVHADIPLVKVTPKLVRAVRKINGILKSKRVD